MSSRKISLENEKYKILSILLEKESKIYEKSNLMKFSSKS